MSFESIASHFSVLEEPEHQLTEHEKYEQTFQSICEKLYELGIDAGKVSIFSLPDEDGVRRLLAMPIHMVVGEEEYDSVRLVFNERENNVVAGQEKMTITDYIIDLRYNGVLEIDSEADSEPAENGNTVRVNTITGPYVRADTEDVTIFFGKNYETMLLPRCTLATKNVVAERLLADLAPIEPVYQDRLGKVNITYVE